MSFVFVSLSEMFAFGVYSPIVFSAQFRLAFDIGGALLMSAKNRAVFHETESQPAVFGRAIYRMSDGPFSVCPIRASYPCIVITVKIEVE